MVLATVLELLLLTEQVPCFLRFTVEWWSDAIFVLSHDAKLVFVPFCEPLNCVETFLWITGDMDPRLPVVLPFLNHVVCDLRTAIICWWLP